MDSESIDMKKAKNPAADPDYLDKKIAYLQLIQEPISRMSSTSAIFKGFSAAILAGLASASFTDINFWALLLGLIPIASFFCLDVYYLSMERKLKYRYKTIARDETDLNFLINTKLNKSETKLANSKWNKCILSPSILLFYVPVFGCAITLLILKFLGVFTIVGGDV